jgi:arylsulfatase A-like enzyme/Flp pilus assembly protein TadD
MSIRTVAGLFGSVSKNVWKLHVDTHTRLSFTAESYQNPLRSALMFVRASGVIGALALGAACTQAPAPPAPPVVASSVLIVTIDTLRADRVGVYGARNVETPNIDRLAAEGAWAPQATVHVPLTRPSHVSLFTGRYPAEHGVRDNISPPLGAEVPLLAERFQRAGFATGAFIASVVLDQQSGLARGFDRYSDRFEPGADRKSGDVVAAEAIAWLAGRQKFFAWVHLYDVHAPYVPPGTYEARYADRPYDGTVAWSDEIVGRLIAALRDAGTLDRTLVIVTSDHGEALGEHGEDVHGYFVYEATLRVPLVLRGPGVKPGTRLGGVARTIDLFPTLVEMTGLAGGGPVTSGQSLAPALKGGATKDQPSFAESLVPLLHYGWSDLRAVRDGRWKYILAPKPELYDLDNDPGELKNLVDSDQAKASAMRASLEQRLASFAKASAPQRAEQSASGVPTDVRERLGALGYVGPGASPVPTKSSGASTTKSDPKDKLADYKALSALMQQGLVALRAGHPADAVAPFQAVARRGIDSFEPHYYLARAYAGLARWREATAEYERALAKVPGDVEAWRGLGESRVGLRDGAGAVRAFEKLVTLAPRDPVALMQLGEAYRDEARHQDAVRVIREALALDPKPAQYWNSLGTVLGASRQMAEAERAFGEATTRAPANGLYTYNRALALQSLGRRDEAAVQMKRAADLGYPPRAR